MAEEMSPPAVTNVATPIVDAPSTSAGDDAQAQGSAGRPRRSRPTRYACVICGRDKLARDVT